MKNNDWHIYVRDTDGLRQGEIDDYTSAEFIPVFNDIGTWSLSVSADSLQTPNLMLPGWGIVAMRDQDVIMSGPVNTKQFDVDTNTDTVTFSGVDDNVWLQRKLAHPIPTDPSPPYTAQAQDTRTGIASTILRQYVDVNLGPSALTQRQLSSLVLGADPIVGPTITGNAQWDILLVFLQTLATNAGIGFQLIQNGNDIEFDTFLPVDRSGTVKFSVGLGNLQAFSYSSTAPTATYVFVGGDGDGTARTIVEMSDPDGIATWGRIEGELVSSSGDNVTNSPGQMTTDGQEALTNGAEVASLSITPIDTQFQKYKQDYFLGDKVTINLGKQIRTPYGITGVIVDTIQSVDIKLDSGAGAITTPIIASAPTKTFKTIWKDFRVIRKRLGNLERH
jgi:hypothetical protein